MDYKAERRLMLRAFFLLLAGIAAHDILALTVNLVDNFMLGRYSEQAMAAASVVNQFQFIMLQITIGVGAGVSVLGAQYWGRKEIVPIKKIIGVGLKIGLAAGLIFTVLTRLFPVQAIGLLTNDPVIIAEAVKYLDIICWTYVIYGISAVLLYSLQSVQTSFIGMIMSAMTIFINMGLNYLLIYGNMGAPEMGIRGAAIATLTSRSVELAVILVYILLIDKKLRMKFTDLLRFDRSYFRDYIRIALPMILCFFFWGIAETVQTSILGHISAEVLAANSVASIVFQLFIAFGLATANASSVIIGKTIGEGRMDLVRPHTRTLQVVFLIIGLVTGALLFLLREPIVNVYHLSPETYRLAIAFLTVFSVAGIGTCYEVPMACGVIAGGGDPRYQVIVNNLFTWLYTIPIACVSAFVLHLPPVATYILLKSDQILKCIPNAIYGNRFTWVRNLTRKEEPEEAGSTEE